MRKFSMDAMQLFFSVLNILFSMKKVTNADFDAPLQILTIASKDDTND